MPRRCAHFWPNEFSEHSAIWFAFDLSEINNFLVGFVISNNNHSRYSFPSRLNIYTARDCLHVFQLLIICLPLSIANCTRLAKSNHMKGVNQMSGCDKHLTLNAIEWRTQLSLPTHGQFWASIIYNVFICSAADNATKRRWFVQWIVWQWSISGCSCHCQQTEVFLFALCFC